MIRSPIFSNYTAIFIGFLLIGIWAGTISIFNKSPFQNDLTQFFPDQQSLETKYLKHRVSPSESTSWLMLAFSVESTHIGQQSTRLKNQLLEIPGVKQVLNGSETFESPHQQNPLPDLYPYRYLLTDFKLPQLKHNIEQRWEEYQHGFILDKHWLLSDPSYQWGIYLNKLKPASNLDKVQGVWVTPKSVSTGLFRTALFLIESEQNPQTIFAINKQLKNLSTLNNYQLSGASWIALQAESDIKQAVNWITAAATAMVIISLFIAFRSIKLIFLCSIPLVAAFAIGILSTISLFGNMQLITLALGAVLLGVAIDYPIHTIAAFQLKDSSIINKIWPTIRLGGLTSAFGFLMLLWINIEGLKQIAVFASTGLLGALLFTYLLKAHLINHYRIAIDSTDNKTAHNLRSINTTNLSIFLITGLLIICTVISLKPIKWQDDIASLSPVSSDLIETDRELRTLFQYQEAGKQLLLSANAIESLLQQQEELIPKLEKLKQNGVLQQYKLLAQLLPSQALQQERQTSLGYHSDLGTALIEATENTKFKPIHFNAFQTDIEYSQSLPLLNFQQFSQSNSISLEIVNQLIIPMDKKFIGVITLSGVVDDNQIYDFVENQDKLNLVYFNQRQLVAQQISEIRSELFQVLSIVIFVLLVSLGLKYRKYQPVLTILGPIILAIGFTLSTFALLEVPLSIFHLMSLMLVAAIGLDYSLLFFQGAQQRAVTKHWNHSVTVAFFTTIGSFGVLSVSQLSLLNAIGLSVLIGVLWVYGLAWLSTKTILNQAFNRY